MLPMASNFPLRFPGGWGWAQLSFSVPLHWNPGGQWWLAMVTDKHSEPIVRPIEVIPWDRHR